MIKREVARVLNSHKANYAADGFIWMPAGDIGWFDRVEIGRPQRFRLYDAQSKCEYEAQTQ